MLASASSADHLKLDHVLGNLQRVERRALADLVAADPEVQTVLDRFIETDAPDLDVVLARG